MKVQKSTKKWIQLICVYIIDIKIDKLSEHTTLVSH